MISFSAFYFINMAARQITSATECGPISLEKGLDLEMPPDTLPDNDKTTENIGEAQEGGAKAWLSLIGASLAMFVSFGWVNCIALFQAEYETNYLKQYSSSTVSWIPSMECTFPKQSVGNYANFVSLLHAFHVSVGRYFVRQLWSPTSHCYWDLHAHFRTHDGQYFNRILSVCSQSICLLWYWSIFGVYAFYDSGKCRPSDT